MNLDASQASSLLGALQQGLFGLAWLAMARLLPDSRACARWWALHALLLAVAGALFTPAGAVGGELWRALGNTALVLSLLALHRGLRCYLGLPSLKRLPLGLGGAALLLCWMGGPAPLAAPSLGLLNALLLPITLLTVVDLVRHGPARVGWRPVGWLALPMVVLALMFGLRALRVLLWPERVIELARHSDLNFLTMQLYAVLGLMFQLVLVTLVVLDLLRRLQRASRQDALTGLLNRGAITTALDEALRLAQRRAAPLSVVLLDMDHFKRLNDRHGHAAGDQALRQLATLLGRQLRASDLAGRYGGEEFLLVLRDADTAGATLLAERLCRALAEEPMHWQGAALPLSASLGLACWRGASAESAEALLARADAALYAAKADGRNLVRVAP